MRIHPLLRLPRAVLALLVVALIIYLLAYENGAAGIRLILVGIWVASMLNALIDWELTRAAQWDLQEELRWPAGSLNGALGVRVSRMRLFVIVTAVRAHRLRRRGRRAHGVRRVPVRAHRRTSHRTWTLAHRPVDEFSGGQRQRVWIAMALAQQTDILLLDEPTTFLDVNHQVEVLDLLTELNARSGATIHDLNLAARYCDRLVMLAGGTILAAGSPAEVLTEDNLREVFGLDNRIIADPVSGQPLMLPIGRHRTL